MGGNESVLLYMKSEPSLMYSAANHEVAKATNNNHAFPCSPFPRNLNAIINYKMTRTAGVGT